jgi:hypothetical protein
MYTIGGETEVCFWRTDRNWPRRGYPGWSHPQIPGKLVASCGRSRCNESFNYCWPLRSSWDGGDHPR